jgi:hypothetical protein
LFSSIIAFQIPVDLAALAQKAARKARAPQLISRRLAQGS